MNTKLPPVSIGIPFYNAERFLMDSIRSVFAQTHQEWELILMDDGSTDRSLEIAKSIDDPRVRVYSDGKNRKLAARLNEIHSLARFEFIARMDADDMMASERIERQLSFLATNSEFDLVTTGVCSVTDDSTPYGTRTVATDHKLTPYGVLSGAHGIIHAAVLGRKEWFLRNRYDPVDHRAQDYKLWVRACRRNDLSIGFIRDPLYYYREEGGVTPQKLLGALKIGRKTFLREGWAMVGPARTVYLYSRSNFKSILIRFFAMAGLTRQLVKGRSPNADPAVLAMIKRDVEKINMTKVLQRRADQ